MRKISEILRLRYELNCSYREIARSQNVGTTTVGEYIARAKSAGIRWPLPEGLSEDDYIKNYFYLTIQETKISPFLIGNGSIKSFAKRE